MNYQHMKNSILQLAMKGKLVEQIDSEETGNDLLAEIVLEKNRLIENKIAKKEKVHQEITNENIPFEIPESWTWTHLSTTAIMYTGNSISASVKKTKYEGNSNGYDYIATKDVGFNNIINYENGIKIPFEEEKFRYADKNSILMCIEGGSAGRKIAKLNKKVCFGNKLCAVKPIKIDENFLYYYLQSPNFTDVFKTGISGIIGGVSIAKLKAIIIPLPPLEEQKRIVAKIEELMPYLEKYGEVYAKLDGLNNKFPKEIENSILKHALEGKLVVQNNEDGSVEELYAQIKKEKHELAIFKNAKNDKHFEDIVKDEKLFEIPDTWKWIRMGELGIYKKGPFGSALTKSMFVNKGEETIKVYEQKNAIKKNHELGDYYIKESYFTEKMTGFEVLPGDIIVSCAGTIGETYIMPDNMERGIINQALMKMNIVSQIDTDFFLIYFDYVLKTWALKTSKGSAIKNIPPFSEFKKMLFPLPPLEEQKRIVVKVNELKALINEL